MTIHVRTITRCNEVAMYRVGGSSSARVEAEIPDAPCKLGALGGALFGGCSEHSRRRDADPNGSCTRARCQLVFLDPLRSSCKQLLPLQG